MTQEELEAYLTAYDPIESIAIAQGIDSLEKILVLTDRAIPSLSGGDHVLSADVMMKSTEKVSFLKHPRFVEIYSHKHNFLEMSYAFSGSCTQIINGNAVEMGEGDITLLDTDVVHTIRKAEADTIIVNVLFRKDYFNHSILARLAENDLLSEFVIDAIYKPTMRGRYLHFASQQNEVVRRYLCAAMREYLDPQLGSGEAMNCYLILLFTELLRTTPHLPADTAGAGRAPGVEILQYIEERYETTTLAQTARHFHFHPNYLSRLLKQNFGKTYRQMVQDLRLRKAKLLLENTDFQVRRIAEEVGYTNFNHFYRKFKETYRATPAEYRKRFCLHDSPRA
ncbi:AraC family transcriptional regulator [Cohnella nanjingensis]|uniref:Helix-turn-helix transcriptional regulator n=1 Tax=Cohnella nanjingensis TaxID=1387779 RepID=A0A7X0RRU5_9BACL|nr:AraC family transcriptional regulator [Cohnella nanjingensis]MBB6672381.1 helix-turn-helix transcriptional regulator [Cohnella nanjingensis]